MATESTHKPRNLIVLCDGTGNSGVRGAAANSTNVSRLCHALQNSPSQIIHYQSGVGTGSIGALYLKYAQGTGLGIDDNILDSYSFLSNNYIAGDRIYIFGFSRGAFTARVLANLVLSLGVFKKQSLWMMKKAWTRYSKHDKGAYFRDFVENVWKVDADRTQKVDIKVLGVWDTVGSVGMPDYEWVKSGGYNSSYAFYDVDLKWGVENAFHAIALDEERAPFTPTLFFLPEEPKPSDKPPLNLKQVWFAGAHSDVGGSYPDCHMADITLFWMLKNCAPHGLLFDEEYLDMRIRLNAHPDQVVSANRPKNKMNDKYPKNGWGCGKVEDSYWKGVTPVLGRAFRTPGEYNKKNGKAGETNETVHLSVRRRWKALSEGQYEKWWWQRETDSWVPTSMKNWKPKEKSPGKWVWVNDSNKLEMEEEEFQEDLDDFEGMLKIPKLVKTPDEPRDKSHWYLSDKYEPPKPR